MRKSLLDPIPELELAAKLLDAAGDALLTDRRALAAELVRRADIPAILDYASKIVGVLSMEVHRRTRRPKCLPKAQRDPTRMPRRSEENAIFARDGWRCRFCGVKVVCKRARAVLAKQLSISAHWTSLKLQRHSALYAMASSVDHIVPHGRGGSNVPSNFVTACYCCQFGRGEWTLGEMELEHPLSREPVVDGWDGLTRIVGL